MDKNKTLIITTKYDKFKVNKIQPGGRIHDRNLEAKLIETGGNTVPAQVGMDYEIIEGHGRFNICKKHNLEFKYEIIDSNKNTISDLNTTSSQWRLIDYIESYGYSDENYMKLYNILSREKVAFAAISSFIGYTNINIKKGIEINIDFDELSKFINFNREVLAITKVTENKSVSRILTEMLKIKEFSKTKFINKLNKYWTTLNPGKIGGEDYIFRRMSEVYDHRDKKKLKLYYLINSK